MGKRNSLKGKSPVLKYLKYIGESMVFDLINDLPNEVNKGNKRYIIYSNVMEINKNTYMEVNYFNKDFLELLYEYRLFKTPNELYLFYKTKLNDDKKF